MFDQHFVVDLFFCMHESVRRKETALPLRPAVDQQTPSWFVDKATSPFC